MRVLMVHPHDIYDPLEPWALRITSLARCLCQLGVEVKLVYHLRDPKLLPGDLRHRQEFPFEVIPWIRHMGVGLKKSREMSALAEWADAVHVQKCLAHAALPAAAAAFSNRIPLHYDWDDWEAAIYEDAVGRDANWRRINRLERALPKIADTVSVASEALRQQALAMGLPADRLFDGAVGADLNRFCGPDDAETLRGELGFDGPVATYVGQLAGAHAAPAFLEAAALVATQLPAAHFLVVGGGRSLNGLKKQAQRVGLGHRIRFTGAVPSDQVARYLAATDVAVATLPDTPQAHTKSPLKIVEYMAAGKAIVASRVGEAVRFLDGGRVGVLVEPGSTEALAQAIEVLLGDPHRRSELGAQAREHLRGHHTWMHTARNLLRAYEQGRSLRGLLVQGRGPRHGLGPEGRGSTETDPRPAAVPQSKIAPQPPRPVTAKTVKRLRAGPASELSKALRGRLDLVGIQDGQVAFTGPYTIQLDVTNRCNNDCIACWLHSPLLATSGPNAKDRRAQLSFPVVRQLLDDAYALGTRDIYMAGGGDPIVYPWLRETIEHVKALGMTVAINTNFTLADEKWCRWACEVGIDDLTLSVWAGGAEGYDATHPNKGPNDFERLKERITFLNRTKAELGRGPTVKIYQVVSNLNAHEFEAMWDFVDETGSEAVEFTVVDTVPGHTDILLFDEVTRNRLLAQSLQLQDRLERKGQGHRLFAFDQWLRRLRCTGVTEGLGDANVVHTFPCTIGWTFLRVMPDGKVTSCLKSHRIPIGNINESRLTQLWNNDKQRRFRRKTKVCEKRDPWFSNIGNDPNVACGCEKSCDDLGRNLATYQRMEALSGPEQALIQLGARSLGAATEPERASPQRTKTRI